MLDGKYLDTLSVRELEVIPMLQSWLQRPVDTDKGIHTLVVDTIQSGIYTELHVITWDGNIPDDTQLGYLRGILSGIHCAIELSSRYLVKNSSVFKTDVQ